MMLKILLALDNTVIIDQAQSSDFCLNLHCIDQSEWVNLFYSTATQNGHIDLVKKWICGKWSKDCIDQVVFNIFKILFIIHVLGL